MTTVPWTTTGDFPHPLTRVEAAEVPNSLANRTSFAAVEVFTWLQLGNVINRFRDDTLELEPVELMLAPGLLHRLRVPVTYIGNPLLPKHARDWPKHVHFRYRHDVGAISAGIIHSFASGLPRCPVSTDRPAFWAVKGDARPISSLAAVALIRQDAISAKDLKLYFPCDWDLVRRPGDPLTGLASATADGVRDVLGGASAGAVEVYKRVTRRDEKFAAAGSQMDLYTSVAVSAGKGIGQVVTASLKTPATSNHGLEIGFHNMPRLYGNATVREPEKITGWKSGFVAAGKGLGYGLYDGLTGFVTPPLNGAKKEGGIGSIKGFSKGVGGLILKPTAGVCGLPGHAFMGLYQEIRKVGRTNSYDLIGATRLARGELEWGDSTEAERLDIVTRWRKGRQPT